MKQVSVRCLSTVRHLRCLMAFKAPQVESAEEERSWSTRELWCQISTVLILRQNVKKLLFSADSTHSMN